MNLNTNNVNLIVQIAIIAVLVFIIYKLHQGNEGMCVKKSYGYVTDVPASNYVDANIALTRSTSLGQAPLGDPRYWLPSGSPITNSGWTLYQDGPIPLSETQPYDRTPVYEAAKQIPIYTQQPLPPQCTPLN